MKRTVLPLLVILCAATFFWVIAPATSQAQSRKPGFALTHLRQTCQEAVRTGCLAEIMVTTPGEVMNLAVTNCSQVRRVAIYTLGEMGETGAVRLLTTMLDDPDRHVRRIAARALGKIGDKRAVEALVAVLSRQSENLTVRCTAAWALGQMGDRQACPALERTILASDGPLRVASRDAVDKLVSTGSQALNSRL